MSDDRCSFGYSGVEPKAPVPGVLYGGLQAVENLKLSQINSLWNVEGMKLPIDQEDRRLMLRVDRVVINVLLYLSHLPFQYETPELRKPRFEGKRMIPGLYPARFIGDLQMGLIPKPREGSVATLESKTAGCDNCMNQTSNPNIPTINRWSRPTFASTALQTAWPLRIIWIVS